MTVIDPASKSMEDIVSLCKRRGFVYPASEIYGGINGFWDYGPLGTALKNNIRDWWWHCMVECPPIGPDGDPVEIVGLDSAIIQNPKTWVASGHAAGFNDPMVDDKETKQRYRADHIFVFYPKNDSNPHQRFGIAVQAGSVAEALAKQDEMWKSGLWSKTVYRAAQKFGFDPYEGMGVGGKKGENITDFTQVYGPNGEDIGQWEIVTANELEAELRSRSSNPDQSAFGTMTEPRMFNLMFVTYVGAIQNEDSKAYLRPETAQGIFLNYKNVLDTMRVKVPFGIAQIGKSFRNEVTPRNFIFRSREFEQMEMEWFCPPDESLKWYEFWKQERMRWWKTLGIADSNLIFRDHAEDELAHYSKACVDVEYKYPFSAPGFGELEGIAHRGAFDLTQHSEHARQKLDYFDQELQVKLQAEGVDKEEIKQRSRYTPNVIEPASGLTRAVLVLLCEAYTPDESRPSKLYMKFKPKFAPIKAGIFPLVNKDGMPEVASKLYLKLREKFTCEYDAKQSIGKRYARMDEAGTPFCVTVDGDSLTDQTVTIRDRDTQEQHRVSLDKVEAFLAEKIGQ